jgi:hypothetical protein
LIPYSGIWIADTCSPATRGRCPQARPPTARRRKRTHAELSKELFMSASQGFRSLTGRKPRGGCIRPLLILPPAPESKLLRPGMWPNNQNLKEFLTFGARYDFPLQRGGEARGVAAADPASPRIQHFAQDFPCRRSRPTRQVSPGDRIFCALQACAAICLARPKAL